MPRIANDLREDLSRESDASFAFSSQSVVERGIRQMEAIASQQNRKMPFQFVAFVNGLATGRWDAVTNAYFVLAAQSHDHGGNRVLPDPTFDNDFWYPVHEAFWTCYWLKEWSPNLASIYADHIMDVTSDQDILLTGTESGLFIVPILRDRRSRHGPSVISINALASPYYLNYLRATSTGGIIYPSVQECSKVLENVSMFEQQKDRPRMNAEQRETLLVTLVNSLIARTIFETNASTRFYVDTGFQIEWMYPYLRPSGLLLEICRHPLPSLDEAEIRMNDAYWKDKETKLLGLAEFDQCAPARAAYARLRAAIGGVYAYRKLYSEAEASFRQALRFYPDSWDTILLIVDLYLRIERFDDASRAVMEFKQRNPESPGSDKLIADVEQVHRLFVRKNELEAFVESGQIDLKAALELTDTYRILNRTSDFGRMVQSIAARADMPPAAFQALTQICLTANRTDLLLAACQSYVEKNPKDTHGLLNLASAYVAAGNVDKALETLRSVAAVAGSAMADLLNDDNRFDLIRDTEEFKKLLATPQGRHSGK